MKRLLLIPALMLGSVAMATDYNYEITPLIGYNIAEGNIDLDDYAVFGAEFQYNGFDSVIKPELSVLYSKADYNSPKKGEDTDVWRVAVNGVYEYDKLGYITPLAKVGLGYENMSDDYTSATGNEANCAFVDVGLGAKIPFNEMIALKLEAIYMLKYNDARYDSNLAVLAGLNIAFGEKAQKAAPVAAAEPTPTPKPAPVVVAAPVIVDGDDDKDGVLNSVDKCPTTPAGVKVDAKGCKIDNDIDKDGVLNANDICPNTPLGEAVNSDGCPEKVTLKVNFENNSADVASSSFDIVQKYADFLTKYTSYSSKIVGYTDSRGSEKYNQNLSEKRANAVKDMLLEKGVPSDRLSAEGKGEANPIADNKTVEGRAENRRIEAELIKN